MKGWTLSGAKNGIDQFKQCVETVVQLVVEKFCSGLKVVKDLIEDSEKFKKPSAGGKLFAKGQMVLYKISWLKLNMPIYGVNRRATL
ncbi:MAG: hypothetical protein GY804_08465 [Alphaproteobacteria bacterium]|nr:hypothetical protein [Alphaproteobacteria bacterium]